MEEKRIVLPFTDTVEGGEIGRIKELVIDIIPEPDEMDARMCSSKPHIIFMTEDRRVLDTDEYAHTPFGYIEFNDIESLNVVTRALQTIEDKTVEG